MTKFTYSAIDAASGKEKKGIVESVSAEQASAELKAMGLIPTSIAVDAASAKPVAVAKKEVKKVATSSSKVEAARLKRKNQALPLDVFLIIKH